jgi:hypothetical protein
MANPKQPPPWERLPEEGEAPFVAFRVYLEQPPPRSIKAVAALVNRSTSTVYKHSRRYFWQARAEAWDRKQSEVEDDAILTERARLAKKRMRQLGTCLELTDHRFAAILEQVETGVGDDAAPDIKAVTYLLDRALHWERTISGEATERRELMEELDLDALTEAELLELKRLQAKARKKD